MDDVGTLHRLLCHKAVVLQLDSEDRTVPMRRISTILRGVVQKEELSNLIS